MPAYSKARLVSFPALLLASALGAFVACSGSGGDSGDDGGGGGGGASSGGGAGAGGLAGSPFGGSAGLPPILQGSGGSPVGPVLYIEPASVALVARGEPLNQAFVAKLNDGTTPSGVTWSMDDVTLGLVGTDGVFRSKGFLGGKAKLRASVGGREAKAEITLTVDIVDNDAGLSPSDQGALQGGGGGDPKLRFLYPYDGTVFPRGVGAPLVQVAGDKAGAARLLLEAPGYRYEGFFDLPATLAVNQFELRDDVWKGLVASAPPGQPVSVSVTTLAGGEAAGPVEQSWSVAPGSLKGVLYYNTYYSTQAQTGAVMTIRPGGSAEVLLSGCTVCHSVSSQGNRLVAALDWDDVDIENNEEPNNPIDSGSFELLPGGGSRSKGFSEDGRRFPYGALTPDGKWFLSNAVLGKGENNGPVNEIKGLSGDVPSRLYETDTGKVVPSPSLEAAITYAMSPAFSHDGTRVAFNRRDVNDGRTLATMRFDASASPPVFSELENLVTVPGGGSRGIAAWPSFLPDGQALVFHEGTGFDTYMPDAKGNLRLVELASRRVHELRALNGENPDGTSYLPFGAELEGDMNFEPTVLPVPVGGYYWVFFTSRRAYGNTIAPYGGLVERGDDVYGYEQNPSPRKKIWVAAIDLDYASRPAGEDPSHPAFYVTGQELEAGNMRAFAALEPCRQQGSSCESGADCCGGFCRQNGVDAEGAPVLQCVPPPVDGGCSNEDETCSTAADCCGLPGELLCINHRCAQPSPIIR